MPTRSVVTPGAQKCLKEAYERCGSSPPLRWSGSSGVLRGPWAAYVRVVIRWPLLVQVVALGAMWRAGPGVTGRSVGQFVGTSRLSSSKKFWTTTRRSIGPASLSTPDSERTKMKRPSGATS